MHIEEDDDYSDEDEDPRLPLEDEDYDHYGDEINGALERGITLEGGREGGIGGWEVEASFPRSRTSFISSPLWTP